jgi:hypothetical protein
MRLVTTNVLFIAWCLASSAFSQEAETTAKPSIPIKATSEQGFVVVHFSGLTADLTEQDIALGALSNDQKPNQHIVPTYSIGGCPKDPKDKPPDMPQDWPCTISRKGSDWDVPLAINNLIPFGESTVPILLKRQPNTTARFQKAGLSAKPPAESGFAVREGKPLFIVLENMTAFEYTKVRARFRFQDVEVCRATADRTAGGKDGDNSKCSNPEQWASFSVPKYAPVTLRVPPAPEWFRDPTTGFPKAAKRKGVLSLQFVGDGEKPAVYEQTIPLEVQFDPSDKSMIGNIVRVGTLLTAGAILALILRVTIPNYRRKSRLKEELEAAAKATRAISDDVESMLRVLLRVERINLDQLRRAAWIGGPSFQDFAVRVEQGLATLKRKIDFARRLDTARGRKAILLDQGVPPKRIEVIDRELDSACETLKRDQLADQDWVYIQQRLEAADKLLHEPTQDEKDAFQALLVQRWAKIRDFFGLDGRRLKVPDALQPMSSAFPPGECLPREDDQDGTRWVADAGHTRADLQLGALEVLRDYLFLAPASSPDPRWTNAMQRLKFLCATPSMENLATARLIIEELADGIDVERVVMALQAAEAAIEMSPELVQPNEAARFALRFKDPKLNTAAARREIVCEWSFGPRSDVKPGSVDPGAPPQVERGWEIYHYFTDKVRAAEVSVLFFVEGKPVTCATPEMLALQLSTSAGGPLTSARPTPPEAAAPADATKPPEPAALADATKPPEPATPVGAPKTPTGANIVGPPKGLKLPSLQYGRTVQPQARARDSRVWLADRFERIFPEGLQLAAALLVPLATLAVTQSDQGTSGQWWELIGVGFGSETIRGILTGKEEQPATSTAPPAQP